MKTRTWIILFCALALCCAAATIWLFRPGQVSGCAQILQDGAVIRTVDLRTDQTFTIDYLGGGSNTVAVHDGKIAVTQADCPDGICKKRGWCSGGTDIVCLPHHLSIHFTGQDVFDGVSGG